MQALAILTDQVDLDRGLRQTRGVRGCGGRFSSDAPSDGSLSTGAAAKLAEGVFVRSPGASSWAQPDASTSTSTSRTIKHVTRRIETSHGWFAQ